MEVAAKCCSGAAVRGLGNEIMLQARNYLVGMLEKGVFMRQVSSIGLGQLNRCNGDSMHVECDNRQVSMKNNNNMEDRFTEAEIFSYIVKNGLAVDAKYVYDYWKKKGWNTKKGEPVKTLAAAVNVCNSIYLTRLKNEMQTSKKHQRDLEEAKLMYDEYNKQLQSKEWESFRNFILTVKGHKCEICGSKTWLQIHHKSYKKAAKAWEYLPNEVVVLCRDCHKNIHKIKS